MTRREFILDIDAEDSDDASLARYTVDDLRALMVGEARVLDGWIILEPQGRSQA